MLNLKNVENTMVKTIIINSGFSTLQRTPRTLLLYLILKSRPTRLDRINQSRLKLFFCMLERMFKILALKGYRQAGCDGGDGGGFRGGGVFDEQELLAALGCASCAVK